MIFCWKTDFTLLNHGFSIFFFQIMFFKIARFHHPKITISQNAKYLFIYLFP
jgi:hypothetical protein